MVAEGLPKKACLFDFDGTLVDTMHGFADIAMRVIHQYHPSISEGEARRLYLETSGIPFHQQLEQIAPQHPCNEEASHVFEHVKAKGFLQTPIPAATWRTLTHLQQAEVITAISSNNFQHLVGHFADNHQLPIDVAMGWQPDLCKGKPHFDVLAERYELSYDQMVFVGDSLSDAALADQNGIYFIAKSGTFSRQAFIDRFPTVPVVDSLEEVLDLVL